MSINISDYDRTGIFIEERNDSVINTPAPQDVIINFIPGFSRKGTVFNRPVLINNKSDRNKSFGDIDRFLEKKGSFFHRTIEIALQSAPVFAMNLLKTNELDVLNYVSLSVAAQYDNDVIKESQYDTYFNKSGFWQRDTESFLFFAKNNERMMHFTNVGDKKITFFVFKSSIAGYDVTAETWYGNRDNVPTWINVNDLISDYIVRVIVLSGDWTNYTQLAVDANWSKYFDSSGLRKNKVTDFLNDRKTTILKDYNGSVIPFFKDITGRNIFIETIINNDTDVTGLFCSFDIDAVETDLPNGNIDIIGQTLVGLEKSKINFLSYQDTIEETDVYDALDLDTVGNVIGVGSITSQDSLYTRTSNFSNGTVNNLSIVLNPPQAPSLISTISVSTLVNSKIIINNKNVSIFNTTTNLIINELTAPDPTFFTYKVATVFVNAEGEFKIIEGTQLINSATDSTDALNLNTLEGLQFPASYPNNALVMFYYLIQLDDAGNYTYTFNNVATNIGGVFQPLTIGINNTFDIMVGTFVDSSTVELNFINTSTVNKANYKAYRNIQFFNELATKYTLANSVLIDINALKVNLNNATITHNLASTNSNDKQITFSVPSATIYNEDQFIIHYTDNEFIMNTTGLESRAKKIVGTNTLGVIGKTSEFYQDYINGFINTGDYFYEKLLVTTEILKFVYFTDTNFPNAIGSYLVLDKDDAMDYGLDLGPNNQKILIDGNINNKGIFNVSTGYTYLATPPTGSVEEGLQSAGVLTNSDLVWAFKLSELVSNETVNPGIDLYNVDRQAYLKMYTLGNVLKVEFCGDATLTSVFTLDATKLSLNQTIKVYSGEASYEQTLEIEQHPNYLITDNKILIDSVRYTEVKVGDYLKAFYNESELIPGEYPKKFARIIKKTPWSGNTTYDVQYSEITTDTKIDITSFYDEIEEITDLQTTRYMSVENYIDTYKGITLSGFTVQTTSIPNGTDVRQNEILDIIGKGTSLFNAIVNKNKFNFRYLIDSFGLGLTEFSKQQIADIAGKRKNCLAFISAPSEKILKNSNNPSFINVDGTLNLEFLKLGGDPDKNPSFLYSFAQGSGKDDGRDASAYFFPYVTVNDNGRPLLFPPAVYCANTYMRKNNSNIAGKYNFTVAAGSIDGLVLGIANTEMDFTENDYSNLNTMGLNPISFAKNIGFYIETEYTASVVPRSALSYTHVREILIDLENELFAMLFKYQYQFNVPAIRAKIKREADDICQKYLDRSAITAFTNIIDETNNTAELIDNQFGLLETYITPVKALATIVNVINIQSNGSLGSSSGFGN